MGFRFRRSVKVLPGVRLNLSGSGPSVSFGGRGFHYTVGSKGTRVTAGIPGTGLSWSEYTPYARKQPNVNELEDNLQELGLPAQQLHHPSEQLKAVQSASAERISAYSTSELAQILNSAHRRLRIAPGTLGLGIVLFIAALVAGNEAAVSATALATMVFVPIAVFIDRFRRSVKVKFEPNGATAKITEGLSIAFRELMQAKAAWAVHFETRTSDWKRNAGATGLNKRKLISLQFGKPHCIRGPQRFPFVRSGSDEIYLLPDAALIITGGEIASVSYRELEFSSTIVRFVEEDRLPADCAPVDYTWRYVNKSGGPDRRFKGNRQLPICLYGEMLFRSAGGLNCKIQISKPSTAEPLSKVLFALSQTKVEIPGPVSYAASGSKWPTAAFASLVLILALADVVALRQGIADRLAALNADGATTRPVASAVATATIRPTPQASKPPLDIRPPAATSTVQQIAAYAADAQPPIDLKDPQNLMWVQSRLRELGYLHEPASGWDSTIRAALRDFKTINDLPSDDSWDFKTEEQLASSAARHASQSFVGMWSETPCGPGAQPEIIINSRRAASGAGGACELSNVRADQSGWTVTSSCQDAGKRWMANIHFAMRDGNLIWTGRDGTQTTYYRCR